VFFLSVDSFFLVSNAWLANADDAELNEVLARTEEEAVIFTQMDEERRRTDKELWGRFGRPVPERLITEAELPDLYRLEHVPEAPRGDVIEDSEGGRRRNKPPVYYDDGLREEEFLAVSVWRGKLSSEFSLLIRVVGNPTDRSSKMTRRICRTKSRSVV
jgi:hypothetical protein